MNVGDIMSTELVTCSPNDTIYQVAKKLQQKDIGSCPIVDQNRLVGIVTDRDITVRAVSKDLDVHNMRVGDIMTTNLVVGSPSMSLEEACILMADHQVRRLPIVENDKLVGIIAQADLAIDLEEDELLAETLEKISEPSHFRGG
ncbi:MAG: CBS domain-containing protein [Armatimonadetes bacterium]|nr:CBS domain-containing protein [Armatimonadota bacterium]